MRSVSGMGALSSSLSFAIRQRSTFLSKPTAAKLPRVWLSLALTALKYWSTSLWSRWPQAASVVTAKPRPASTDRCRMPILIVVLLSPLPVVSGLSGRGSDVLALFALRQPRYRHQVVPFLQLDEAHPLGIPADGRDVRRVQADDHTLFGDEHHALVALQELDPHHLAVAAGGLDVDEALAAAALDAVLVEGGLLAVAVLGHGEHGAAGGHDLERDHLVPLLQLDALHAVGGPPHRPHVFLAEVDGHPVAGGEQDLVRAGGQHRLDEGVVVLDRERDDATCARVREGGQLRLLHDALAGGEKHVAAGDELLDRGKGGDLLLGLELDEVDDGLAPALRPHLGDLVDLQPVDAAARS